MKLRSQVASDYSGKESRGERVLIEYGTWFPYGGTGAVVLAVTLLAI